MKQDDIVAVSDDVNETHLLDWRTQNVSIFWGTDEPSEHNFQVSLRSVNRNGSLYQTVRIA